MKKQIKKLAVALAAFMMFVPSLFAADYLPVQAYATDTVAGYPSLLRTSIINPNQDVKFVVERPDGGVVQIPAQADLEGVAKADLYGHQTKISGDYKVAVVYPGSATSSPQTSFKVFPDNVSLTQSSLRSTLQMVESGKDATFLVATLYDQYRNPIPNHRVKLISSRSEDSIEVLQDGITDKNGRANFKVTSQYPGVSVFTAMDVTMNQLLDDREEVVFYAPSVSTVSPFSASLLSADIGGNSTSTTLPGPVDHFEISGLPSSAKVGEQLSMTVTAQDKDDNTATNYTGTIIISVPDDENATLPNNGEYTFKAADQGKFTFSLSLVFSEIGKQSVEVLDKSNFKISGDQEVDVVSSSAVVTSGTSSTLQIKSPADGSELGSSLVIITGQGDENIDLKVFDNDVKIGDTETDGDGFFSYQAKNLSSGSHKFYVMSEKNEVSKSVSVTIDTTAPVLNSFKMDAQGSVSPGTKVEITVQSEKNLDEAKVRLQGVTEDMTESSSVPGNYSVTVTAPAQDGSFPVDVILVDSLSNKAEFTGKGTITVKTPAPSNPPKVEGLNGTAGDSKVELTWTDVTGHTNAISKYRIYYGTQMDKLDSKVDTTDSTAKWELRNLTNGTQYFIAVKAVDSKGLESSEFSTKLAVTPKATDLCEDVDCGDYGTCDSTTGKCTCDTGWSGDECDVADVTTTTTTPTTTTPTTTTPTTTTTTTTQPQASASNGTTILSWSPFAGVQAYYYKVFIGFSSGNYSDYVITQDNRTSVAVEDLVPGVTYYFAVAALDINQNQISQLSQEFTVTPTGTTFHSAASTQITYPVTTTTTLHPGANMQPTYQYTTTTTTQAVKTKTGPEAIWVILASLVFAHFLYHHKRKVVSKINS